MQGLSSMFIQTSQEFVGASSPTNNHTLYSLYQ